VRQSKDRIFVGNDVQVKYNVRLMFELCLSQPGLLYVEGGE